MELRRIVIKNQIITQELSSKKNITKEIPKNDKTDYPTNKREEYSFCQSVTECQNLPKENILLKKYSKQTEKNENNINRQLTEVRHK